MAKRKTSLKAHFFARELKGEEPLHRKTAIDLLETAYEILELKPWEMMQETELVFVWLPGRTEPDTCSVMGAVYGEFAVHVYLGLEGFRHFVTLQEAMELTPTVFFERSRFLRMAFEPSAELPALDRDLLRDTGFARRGGGYAVRFESYRPGYLPWCINQDEGRRLTRVLGCLLEFLNAKKQQPGFDFWGLPGRFPTVVLEQEGRPQIFAAEAPALPEESRETAGIDAVDAALFERLAIRAGFTMQVGFYLFPVPIGEKHERKMCMRLAVACDGKSGFLFRPQVVTADVPPGRTVADATVAAIRSAGFLPQTIQVTERRFAEALNGLRKLGVRIQKVKHLPQVEAAAKALERTMR